MQFTHYPRIPANNAMVPLDLRSDGLSALRQLLTKMATTRPGRSNELNLLNCNLEGLSEAIEASTTNTSVPIIALNDDDEKATARLWALYCSFRVIYQKEKETLQQFQERLNTIARSRMDSDPVNIGFQVKNTEYYLKFSCAEDHVNPEEDGIDENVIMCVRQGDGVAWTIDETVYAQAKECHQPNVRRAVVVYDNENNTWHTCHDGPKDLNVKVVQDNGELSVVCEFKNSSDANVVRDVHGCWKQLLVNTRYYRETGAADSIPFAWLKADEYIFWALSFATTCPSEYQHLPMSFWPDHWEHHSLRGASDRKLPGYWPAWGEYLKIEYFNCVDGRNNGAGRKRR
ncbi:hypothetical protein BKA69DRAFT_1057330 [Paraphysoderma sedebokerense]|nr:hypothetical protein BKA69DRAFT_1057330 [Paraphysoderma sedebokerense]